MKKYLIIILIFILGLFLLFGKKSKEVEKMEEKRFIFISYIELAKYLNDKEETVMKNTIDDMINQCKDFGFTDIILQVRSFSDAIYYSDIFPSSITIVAKEGDKLPFDVLDYFIKISHKNNIRLHAWINPYRIRSNLSKEEIKDNNPAFKYLNTNKVEKNAKGIFYNPADEEVRKLILSGVDEILDNYDIDGIHYDDYFYPSDTIDLENYNEAKKDNQDLTLQQFRLENTTKLIKETYERVKKRDKNILFGISPEGNITNNYEVNYIDTKKFASEEGYVDYLMPQIYFGFFNSVKPFYQTVKEWNSYITTDKVKLIPALAFYKVGCEDLYAKEGQYEWVESNNIIAREVLTSRPLSNYQGFAIFRYDSILSDNLTEQAFKEKENLKNILKD
ncbi:MAG: family 10 glycosylhydrolase [bacterium]|nr:family 10 glycosylhydrolase [bacterium]